MASTIYEIKCACLRIQKTLSTHCFSSKSSLPSTRSVFTLLISPNGARKSGQESFERFSYKQELSLNIKSITEFQKLCRVTGLGGLNQIVSVGSRCTNVKEV